MSKFKIGDKVTMVNNKPWALVRGMPPHSFPIFGEIYTVAVTEGDQIGLFELGVGPCGRYDGWEEKAFEKVVSDAVLREELESVPEPSTI
jgi:hypothetical protein